MKIIDIKCALIGNSPVVRLTTDDGVDGYGQVEWSLPRLALQTRAAD
jgi:L-alanine-DL-glutamate epimerase-like enolase superfamily enzyme